MEEFYKDTLRFGCLGCFKHFQLYLRGREELLVIVRCGAEQMIKNPAASTVIKGNKPLPPASPASRDNPPLDPKEMVFLIGSYARYNWPYVWLRSYQGILSTSDKDLPLDLKSTQSWNKGNGKRVWHIVEELIQLNVLPFPANPFEIDFRQVAELPQTERLLMTGALAAFLRELLQQKFSYTELVLRDLKRVLDIHFRELSAVGNLIAPPQQ